jgi:hypothetical protein
VGVSVNGAGDPKKGVWLLDHENVKHIPATRASTIETAWIEPFRSDEKKSPVELNVWLRESHNSIATIKTYRDWRMTNPVATDTTQLTLVPQHDLPPLYGAAFYAQSATPNQFVKRRAFWKKVHIDIPSSDVYKIHISSTSRMEFIGLRFRERGHAGTGRME